MSRRDGRELKGATRITPAKAVRVAIWSSEFSSEDDSGSLRGMSSLEGLAKLRATALDTAVPRDWPRRTMRSGGILAVCITQLTIAVPSAMRPASEGEPVECPNPR